jgi:hypothetical protein
MAFYTKEQRKEPLIRHYNYFKFETKNDLSGGVKVYETHTCGSQFEKRLAAETANFIAYFMLFHYPHLNGFSGMDTINWKL